MIYNFLTQADIEGAIKPQYLQQLLDGQAANHLSKKEAAAVSFVKGYLANRFNLELIFLVIKDHNPLFAYTGPDLEGQYTDYCYFEGKIYAAKAEVPPSPDPDNPSPELMPGHEDSEYWVEHDPRNQNLVMQITNITVFYLHRHVNPVRIPSFWIDLYNQAKDWLIDVKDSNVTPDFPRKIEETGDDVLWGSNPPIQHRY